MSTETFFTLAEYKQNFDRLNKEFINAYVDNDEEEFISLQTDWYQKCLKNTILEHGIVADSVGMFTKAIISGEGYVRIVDEKVRSENGIINPEVAQNLNVSFTKIIKFLRNRDQNRTQNSYQSSSTPTQSQWALYHYILQESRIKPRFQQKVKEITDLAEKYGVGFKNLQLKYNQIDHSGGQEGYTEIDVNVVEKLLAKKYPSAIPNLKKITQHVF